jgi:glucosamine--fructose-6-phosphate aminotransferase (isomerizing)
MNAPEIEKLAQTYAQFPRFLFIGRGLLEPIAREGALKLKEISYIQAEGMPAAELKHGPIALIDDQTPVVAFAPSDSLYVKMISNISEVRARKGPVLAIATEGNRRIENHTDHVIRIPVCDEMVTPIISVTVAQLFAYYIAEAIGCDIDQPRNLAKSVTVE